MRRYSVLTITRWTYGAKPAVKRGKKRRRSRLLDVLPCLLDKAPGDHLDPDVSSRERFVNYLVQMAGKEPKMIVIGLCRILSSEPKEDCRASQKVRK
jgi:hypothetical protein